MKFLVATIAFMLATLPALADEATRLAIASAQSQVAALESAGVTREENPDAWAKADSIAELVGELPVQKTMKERVEQSVEDMEDDPTANFAESIDVYNDSVMSENTSATEELGILIAEQKEVHRIAMLEAQRAALDAILNPPPAEGVE